MKIVRLFTDRQGETHFEDIEIPLRPAKGRAWNLSRRLAGRGIVFGESNGQYEVDWELAPRKQYVINLGEPVELTASDGETRTILPGQVVLMEDTDGKGHLTRSVSKQVRRSAFVAAE